MENPITVTEFESFEHHSDPAFNILGLKDESTITNDGFEVRIEEFEDEVEVRLVGEDVEERNDIGVREFAEEFHFADRGHVETVFELADFDLCTA